MGEDNDQKSQVGMRVAGGESLDLIDRSARIAWHDALLLAVHEQV